MTRNQDNIRTIKIPRPELEHWNKLLALDAVDFDELDLPEDSTLYCNSVVFPSGVCAELRVCSGQHNLWAEVVWYSKTGEELSCSPAEYELEGEWHGIYDQYMLIVEAEDDNDSL